MTGWYHLFQKWLYGGSAEQRCLRKSHKWSKNDRKYPCIGCESITRRDNGTIQVRLTLAVCKRCGESFSVVVSSDN